MLKTFDLKSSAEFKKEEIFKKVFLEHGHLKAQITCLSAGQPADILLTAISLSKA
jgi:hypothetical protein